MSRFAVVLTTAGSEEEALRIARATVEGGHAACVSVVPGVRSIYRWKGEVRDDREWLCVIKTETSRFDALAAAVRAAHSYEVPELVLLPIETGDPRYLAWLAGEDPAG